MGSFLCRLFRPEMPVENKKVSAERRKNGAPQRFSPCGAPGTKRGRALEKLTRAGASWSEFEPRSFHGPWSFRSFGLGSWMACSTWFPARLLRVHSKPVLRSGQFATRESNVGAAPAPGAGKSFFPRRGGGGVCRFWKRPGACFASLKKKERGSAFEGRFPRRFAGRRNQF